MDNFSDFQKILILEKRIDQISSTIEVTFGFDVIKNVFAGFLWVSAFELLCKRSHLGFCLWNKFDK